MVKLKTIIDEGKEYVSSNKLEEWELFCITLYKKNEMRQIALEIIEDSVKTMKLLDENNLRLEKIVEEVGRSWKGGISCCLLTLIVEKFSKNSERYVKAYNDMRQSIENCKKIDDILRKIR